MRKTNLTVFSPALFKTLNISPAVPPVPPGANIVAEPLSTNGISTLLIYKNTDCFLVAVAALEYTTSASLAMLNN
ncbi:hypothetical protein D3C71_2102980 [compost metagenome]